MATSYEVMYIKDTFLAGISVMEEFGWVYPAPSSTTLGRDHATKGFETFLKGVTRLSTVAGRMKQQKAKEYAASLTDDFDRHWPGVLRFLATMGIEKKASASQINFVLDKLTKLSPSFVAAAAMQNRIDADGDRSPCTTFYDMHSKESVYEIDSKASTKDSSGEDEAMSPVVSELLEQEYVVMKNGWRRARMWDKRKGLYFKEIAKLDEGTVVKMLNDDGGEYAQVHLVGWMKREYLHK